MKFFEKKSHIIIFAIIIAVLLIFTGILIVRTHNKKTAETDGKIPVSNQVETKLVEKELTEAEKIEMQKIEEYMEYEDNAFTTAEGDESPYEETYDHVYYNNDPDIQLFERGIELEALFFFRYWLEDYLRPITDSKYYHITFDNSSYDDSDPNKPYFYVEADEIPGTKIKCIWSVKDSVFYFEKGK